MMNKPTPREIREILEEYTAVTEFPGGPTIHNLLMIGQIETTNRLIQAQIDTNLLLGQIASSLETMEPKPNRLWSSVIKFLES